jgi:hypothetical protein
MKTNILKGLTMLLLIVAIAFATAVVSANAQSRTDVVANIPFEFVVGEKSLPAGEYSVKTATVGSPALAIQNLKNGASALRLSEPTDQSKTRTSARLVFHRYGPRYFLAQVWTGESIGRKIIKSREERAFERELASIQSKSEMFQSLYETVEVVAVLR